MNSRALPLVIQDVIADREISGDVSLEAAQVALRGRLGGLLITAAKCSNAVIEQSARLRLHTRRLRVQASQQQIAEQVRGMVQCCDNLGETLHVFKGLVLAHDLYESPVDRGYSDIDLYVGRWPTPVVGAFARALGLGSAQIRAIELEAASTRPLHEITIGGENRAANIDMHFNPYGLITPFRGRSIDSCFVARRLPGIGSVMVPTAALSLIISLINLTRKGGGPLWQAADSVRLLAGRAGPLDWGSYDDLVAADGLKHICAQAMWAIADDVALELDVPVARPKRRARWAPTLGVNDLGLRRWPTVLPFRRPPGLWPEGARSVLRWYLPGHQTLDALGSELDRAGPSRLWHHGLSRLKGSPPSA